MESMSHCGSSSVEIQFSTFPLKKKEKKAPPTEPSHHTLLWNSGVCHCFLANSSFECFRSVEEWEVLTSGMVSRSIIAPSPLTRTSNHDHSKHMCFFFLCLSLSLFITLAPSTPLPAPPNIQSSEPACWWEVSLFSLLNFPSSGRFLTDSYTSVPLFLLNSLLGLCAGGMREAHRAVRNHCASCLTLPCDSHLPFLHSFLPPVFLHVFIAVHFWRGKPKNS